LNASDLASASVALGVFIWPISGLISINKMRMISCFMVTFFGDDKLRKSKPNGHDIESMIKKIILFCLIKLHKR